MSTGTHTHSHSHSHTHGGGCCSSQESSCSSQASSCSTSAPAPMAQLQAPTSYVYDETATDAVVRLTEKAAVEIKRFVAEKNVPDNCVLRIAVRGGGCSGFEPHLGFDNRIDEEADFISEQFGIRVAMDRKFEMFMQGTTIDYLDGIDRRGFKFDNPNAQSSCGCGKSFSV